MQPLRLEGGHLPILFLMVAALAAAAAVPTSAQQLKPNTDTLWAIQQAIVGKPFLNRFANLFLTAARQGRYKTYGPVTILVPSNFFLNQFNFSSFTLKQQLDILNYHTIRGKFSYQTLLRFTADTIFRTQVPGTKIAFRTLFPRPQVYFVAPASRQRGSIVSPVNIANAAVTPKIYVHGISLPLMPPTV